MTVFSGSGLFTISNSDTFSEFTDEVEIAGAGAGAVVDSTMTSEGTVVVVVRVDLEAVESSEMIQGKSSLISRLEA